MALLVGGIFFKLKCSGYSTPKTLNNRDRCRVGQVRGVRGQAYISLLFTLKVPIFDGPMEKLGNGATYEELFVTCLKNFGVLCIGLYRFSKQQTLFETSVRKTEMSTICCVQIP